jgi:hypothetical protein
MASRNIESIFCRFPLACCFCVVLGQFSCTLFSSALATVSTNLGYNGIECVNICCNLVHLCCIAVFFAGNQAFPEASLGE